MQKPLPILSTGIDWITTTTKEDIHRIFVTAIANHWIETQRTAGHDVHDFAWQGYVGSRTEGVSFGHRDDGTLVRLSGDMARLHGHVLAGRADHVSRLDLQITLQDENVSRDWAEIAADVMSTDRRVSDGATALSVISSNRSKSSLYLGRRISDRFYRIYDKHSESKGAWPEGSWRFEIEYKGKRAEHWADVIGGGASEPSDTRQIVTDAFRDYGFALPTAPLPRLWHDVSPRPITTDERRLHYLGTCVRPMVQKLIEAYGPQLIRDVLDLNDAKEAPEVE
jgi:hypothetical protein